MSSNAEPRSSTLGPYVPAEGRAAAGQGGAPPRPTARTRTVLIYIALALLALAPGALLRLELGFGGSLADAPLQALRQVLDDIRFGGGLRFWLGVAGAGMMALLLLYPLRKAFAARSRVGSVGAWFHIHMILGLAGPVLVLYHSNFGLGGRNANVALWSMLIVVASGIVGHFVYANASAKFYAGKEKAREQLDAIIAILGQLNAVHVARRTIAEELDGFDAQLLTPRQGVVASLKARWQVENRRRHFGRALSWLLQQSAGELGLARNDHERLRAAVGVHLAAYFRYARHAASRSVVEQIWARWRLFHLPVFLIMVVAAVLHVWAVWGMDPPEPTSAPAQGAAAPVSPTAATVEAATKSARTGGPEVRRVTSVPVAPQPELPKPVARARPESPKSATEAKPATPPKPQIATRPAPAAEPQSAPVAPPVTPPPPIVAKAPPPQAIPPAPPEYAELQRRLDEPKMALGGARPGDLTAQIAALKEKMRLQQFFHSEMETGFPLTGKHKGLDCKSCHSKPLQEARPAVVRTCMNCHKKDDIHRGKRPDCAQCHTTNRWSQIIKRR